MAHYKLQPMKSETCYRLIPTIMFIIAITTVVLTIFFMLVLQSRNAHTLDDEYFNIDNDEFQMEISGATSDQIANLDLDNISFEDSTDTFITTQPPPFETFLLKKTINPSTNNDIKTINTNLRSMKAYKIVSKEPIIENSLVKIVMAPQNILEKLSKEDRSSVKYVADKIDDSGNVPIKNYSMDDIFERELIQNGNGNVQVDVFSLEEDEGNVGLMENIEPKKNIIESNNIQVIAKSQKQPLNIISIEQRNPFDLNGNVGIISNDAKNIQDEIETENYLQSIDAEMEPKEIVSEVDLTTTTEAIIDSTYTEAEELLSNPTTSQNLLQEDVQPEFEGEDKVSNVIDSSSHPISFQDLDNSHMASSELSTESNVPLVVLKILKNRTVLIEETDPESTSDQLSMTTTSIPTQVFPTNFKRPPTTTKTPVINEVKLFQFPKKAKLMDPQGKYKNPVPKFEDMFSKMTPQTRLLDLETTPLQSEFTAKSKNKKRAIGDEGKFANIVRPSPIRPKNIGNFLPRETEAQRAERLSKSMKHLMNFVTIVGHVDSYLTKRFRHGLKNVVKLLDSVEETRRRRSNF